MLQIDIRQVWIHQRDYIQQIGRAVFDERELSSENRISVRVIKPARDLTAALFLPGNLQDNNLLQVMADLVAHIDPSPSAQRRKLQLEHKLRRWDFLLNVDNVGVHPFEVAGLSISSLDSSFAYFSASWYAMFAGHGECVVKVHFRQPPTSSSAVLLAVLNALAPIDPYKNLIARYWEDAVSEEPHDVSGDQE